MATYLLGSGTSGLVAVSASSNLDGAARTVRRGSVYPLLGGGTAVQYMDSAVGDIPIIVDIPRADNSQRGILRSASTGTYGDSLTLTTPKYGAISVAFAPNEEGFEEEWLPPMFGYRIRLRFVRL